MPARLRSESRICPTIAASVVAMWLGAAGASAQQPPSQRPSFRTGVEVVLIDVTVVDPAGAPVGDLRPEDFQVKVDHKARTIVSAQFVRYETRAVTDRAKAAAPASASSSAALLAHQPRNILIVFDEENLDTGDCLQAKKAAERLLDELMPDDRVGVVTIPYLRAQVELSTRRSDVRKALAAVSASVRPFAFGFFNIGLYEAFEIERGDSDIAKKVIARECSTSPMGPECGKLVMMEAHQVALQAHLRGQRSLNALYALADGMSVVPGPKTVVLISGGMPMPDLKSVSQFDQIERAFAAAQVSLYTLYLERSFFGQGRVKPPPTPEQDAALERDGLENTTSVTGGTLMLGIGTLEQYFDRVVTEMSGVYLLAVEVAPADRNGRPHFVDVKVNRRGLDVRARKQYVIESPSRDVKGRSADAAGPAVLREPPRLASQPLHIHVTTPEVQVLVGRAGRYVGTYETEFSGLVAEERYLQKLFRLQRTAVTQYDKFGQGRFDEGIWALVTTRDLRADYLLVKAPGLAGWLPFRDVYQMDGKKTRDREERLQKLFLTAPATATQRATEIMNESARYNIGFVERNVNLPTLALMFLTDANRTGFSFWKLGEPVVNGTRTWEIAYAERGSPTVMRTDGGDMPAEGSFCVDPETGRVVRSTVRLRLPAVTSEITVTYRPDARAGATWVPGEMHEVYETRDRKLECTATYSNIRRFQVTTDVQIPKH